MYNKSLETMGYYQILEKLADYAVTEKAKESIRQTKPFLSETALRKSLKDTTQARKLIELSGLPPLPNMEHVEEYLDRAVRGELLTSEHFEQIALFLNGVKRLKSYLIKGQEQELSIAFYNDNLKMPEYLREEIARCIRNKEIDDHASSYLKDVRRQIQTTREKMASKADQALKTYKSFTSDSFISTRNGRLCIPVKKEYRGKVDGAVAEKSSTGYTLFIEPKGVSQLREELELLKLQEDGEERRILYTLLEMLAGEETALREDIRVIALLDHLFAKGKYSLDIDAVEPSINLNRSIQLCKARHPMLDKKTCVPLDLHMGSGVNGIIITGPNTGGKTVTLKTTALLSAMACSGLHIPCTQADIAMNCQILCDIGDGQNMSDNLSTFSAHIKNVLEILELVNSETLVIMDELGSGTDPAEGMGIAISVLEELRESKALFLVTTHYPEVKEYASRHQEVINARMEFDKESLKPLYKICLGESGDSCALYIAKRLGIPTRMLKIAAEEAYGSSAQNILENLRDSVSEQGFIKRKVASIQKQLSTSTLHSSEPGFCRGDSVEVLPDKQIGIVVTPADKQGNVLVQIKKEKILVNHKRLKLKVAAKCLYPEDYDFSIIFDTVENRKARHKMGKKHQEGLVVTDI